MLADSLVAAYAGSEHAAFGHALAVRAAVAQRDEAGAVAALTALAVAFPEADEVGSLAALVAGAFPDVDLTAIGLRIYGGAPGGGGAAAAPAASASASAGALLTVGEPRPNPSSSGMTLPVTLNDGARVEAVLYDALGRRVAVLAEGAFAAGRHELALEARLVPGVYVVRVAAGGEVAARTVTVLR